MSVASSFAEGPRRGSYTGRLAAIYGRNFNAYMAFCCVTAGGGCADRFYGWRFAENGGVGVPVYENVSGMLAESNVGIASSIGLDATPRVSRGIVKPPQQIAQRA